jgi:hypothetical protein
MTQWCAGFIKRYGALLRAVCAFTIFTTPNLTYAENTVTTVGWVEDVLLSDAGLRVKAKLDTGAKTSSIDADIVDSATRKHAGDMIVFSILGEDPAHGKTFERKIVRMVRIKKKGGGYIRRPVVEMTFCIAGKTIQEEVNLANRENFIYPVLIGRNMMRHTGLVIDPTRTHITNPTCKPKM